jgi:hypothetical protein
VQQDSQAYWRAFGGGVVCGLPDFISRVCYGLVVLLQTCGIERQIKLARQATYSQDCAQLQHMAA